MVTSTLYGVMYKPHFILLWKIKTSWKCNVLTIKLHIDIVHLVGCNKIIYQVMHEVNDDDNINIKKKEPCKAWNSVEIKLTWKFNSSLII